jgi:hypothetical protein
MHNTNVYLYRLYNRFYLKHILISLISDMPDSVRMLYDASVVTELLVFISI